MTTISIRPVREAHEWDFLDSSTFNDYLRNARVVSSKTPTLPDIAINVHGTRAYNSWEFEGWVNQWRELCMAEWFTPTLKAMAALPWGSDNWTTGGRRTQPTAVANMLKILVDVLDSHTPPPSIGPTWSGGVQAEWHRNNVDFEIEVDPQGEIEYFFSSPNEEREGRVWDDLDQLAKYVQAITISE